MKNLCIFWWEKVVYYFNKEIVHLDKVINCADNRPWNNNSEPHLINIIFFRFHRIKCLLMELQIIGREIRRLIYQIRIIVSRHFHKKRKDFFKWTSVVPKFTHRYHHPNLIHLKIHGEEKLRAIVLR